MAEFKSTPCPSYCPWGQIDHRAELAPGVWTVSTPSHGGIHVSDERRTAMPAIETFAGGNWFEEDCDWAWICLVWPEIFPEATHQIAKEVALWNNPIALQRFPA
jgi:hypothetical protein